MERRRRLRTGLYGGRGVNRGSVRGWLSCRGRAESIKSNVWWRYNEMNLCRAVMPEYLATLFWFCSWPSRHPSRYTVFELNSTTGLSSITKIGRTDPTEMSRHTLFREIFLKRRFNANFSARARHRYEITRLAETAVVTWSSRFWSVKPNGIVFRDGVLILRRGEVGRSLIEDIDRESFELLPVERPKNASRNFQAGDGSRRFPANGKLCLTISPQFMHGD